MASRHAHSRPRDCSRRGARRHVAGQDVEGAADPHDHGHVEGRAVPLAPRLLERAGHPHEQHVRRRPPDVLDDVRRARRGRSIRRESRPREPGVARARSAGPARSPPRAARPGGRRCSPCAAARLQQPGHQVDAGHALGERRRRPGGTSTPPTCRRPRPGPRAGRPPAAPGRGASCRGWPRSR